MYEHKEADGSITLTGYSKKVYWEEYEILYSDEFSMQITQKESTKIYSKLIRHFKLGLLHEIRFTTRDNGRWTISYWNSCELIYLPNKPFISLGMLCHEIAHSLTYKKHGRNCHHNKKFKSCMKQVINYVRKKNYWI